MSIYGRNTIPVIKCNFTYCEAVNDKRFTHTYRRSSLGVWRGGTVPDRRHRARASMEVCLVMCEPDKQRSSVKNEERVFNDTGVVKAGEEPLLAFISSWASCESEAKHEGAPGSNKGVQADLSTRGRTV